MDVDWFRSQVLNSRDITVIIIEVEYLPIAICQALPTELIQSLKPTPLEYPLRKPFFDLRHWKKPVTCAQTLDGLAVALERETSPLEGAGTLCNSSHKQIAGVFEKRESLFCNEFWRTPDPLSSSPGSMTVSVFGVCYSPTPFPSIDSGTTIDILSEDARGTHSALVKGARMPDNWPAVEEKGGSIVHGLFGVAAGNGLR
ncbi:hypothetical protein BDR22DRAFT_826872 [Usnea florida]